MTDESAPNLNFERGWLICKHGMFYRVNSQGYTPRAIEAGRYNYNQAVLESHPNGKDGPRDGMFIVHESRLPFNCGGYRNGYWLDLEGRPFRPIQDSEIK